jgi:hypothetical protein
LSKWLIGRGYTLEPPWKSTRSLVPTSGQAFQRKHRLTAAEAMLAQED